MIEDTSSEFDMFEDVRRKLTEIFLRGGRELIEAERIALYIVQGVRDHYRTYAQWPELAERLPGARYVGSVFDSP